MPRIVHLVFARARDTALCFPLKAAMLTLSFDTLHEVTCNPLSRPRARARQVAVASLRAPRRQTFSSSGIVVITEEA